MECWVHSYPFIQCGILTADLNDRLYKKRRGQHSQRVVHDVTVASIVSRIDYPRLLDGEVGLY